MSVAHGEWLSMRNFQEDAHVGVGSVGQLVSEATSLQNANFHPSFKSSEGRICRGCPAATFYEYRRPRHERLSSRRLRRHSLARADAGEHTHTEVRCYCRQQPWLAWCEAGLPRPWASNAHRSDRARAAHRPRSRSKCALPSPHTAHMQRIAARGRRRSRCVRMRSPDRCG